MEQIESRHIEHPILNLWRAGRRVFCAGGSEREGRAELPNVREWRAVTGRPRPKRTLVKPCRFCSELAGQLERQEQGELTMNTSSLEAASVDRECVAPLPKRGSAQLPVHLEQFTTPQPPKQCRLTKACCSSSSLLLAPLHLALLRSLPPPATPVHTLPNEVALQSSSGCSSPSQQSGGVQVGGREGSRTAPR